MPGYFKFTILTDHRTTQSLRNCFSLRRKFVIEELECSVILKYKSNSLTKHTDSTVRCL